MTRYTYCRNGICIYYVSLRTGQLFSFKSDSTHFVIFENTLVHQFRETEPMMRFTFKPGKLSSAYALFSTVMRLLRSAGHNGAGLLLVVSTFFLAAAPSLAKTLPPPSQITALSFAYHTMTAHTCGPDITRSCAEPTLASCKQHSAIIRTDYRVLPNGMASVWMELLTQPQATSNTAVPIMLTTIELDILSNPEGELVTSATRTLSSETWEHGTDLEEVLAESCLKGMVYRWLMLFEQPDADETSLFVHIQSTTTLDPATGPHLTGYEHIRNWFSVQRQRQKGLHQQIKNIEIALLSPQHYRLDFAVNWQGRGTDDMLHIGRKEYHWEVELGTDGVMHIIHIKEQDALPLPNMGTRIFC